MNNLLNKLLMIAGYGTGIADVPIDHSFLRYKNELTEYGYAVKKISLNEKKVTFEKC